MENMRNCGCQREANCDNTQMNAIAMAYVPWQRMKEVYEPAQALRAGTLFPELDKPFYGYRKGARK
jgi:hypothetical protein